MDARAVVKRVDDRDAIVELLDKPGSCGRCDQPGGCRSAQLTQLFGESCRTYRLPNTIQARPGEQVLVRIAEGAPLRAALAVYFVPVVFLLAGAAAGSMAAGQGGPDWSALVGAGAGLVAAGAWIAGFRRRYEGDPAIRPRLVRQGEIS